MVVENGFRGQRESHSTRVDRIKCEVHDVMNYEDNCRRHLTLEFRVSLEPNGDESPHLSCGCKKIASLSHVGVPTMLIYATPCPFSLFLLRSSELSVYPGRTTFASAYTAVLLS